MHAFAQALAIAKSAGLAAVETIAKDEKARSFYARYGFGALLDDPRHLYVSIAAVRAAFDGDA